MPGKVGILESAVPGVVPIKHDHLGYGQIAIVCHWHLAVVSQKTDRDQDSSFTVERRGESQRLRLAGEHKVQLRIDDAPATPNGGSWRGTAAERKCTCRRPILSIADFETSEGRFEQRLAVHLHLHRMAGEASQHGGVGFGIVP